MIEIDLFTVDQDTLKLNEKIIENYLKRIKSKVTTNWNFQNWNQNLINYFFSYSHENSILCQLNEEKKLIFFGSINEIHQVQQKYEFIQFLVEIQMNFKQISFKNYFEFPLKISMNLVFIVSINDLFFVDRISEKFKSIHFHVEILHDSLELNRTKIDQADCLILCLSESFFHDDFTYENTIYAYEKQKALIPIRLSLCYQSQWLSNLIGNNNYFFMNGSEQFIEFQCEKLILKIVRKIIHCF